MSQQPSTTDTEGQSALPAVPRRSPWRRVVLGILILACGIAIGAGGATIITRKITRGRILQAWHRPGRTPDLMAERIKRDLHLSPDQAKQVREIVARRLGQVREVMEENRPRVDEQFDLMKEEVAEVLDEDQAREWRKRFERLRRSPGPPRGRHRGGPKDRRTGESDDSGASGVERRGQREDARPRQPL